MCGVFGLVYPNTVGIDQQRFIEQATYVGSLRGLDSTGLAFVDKDNNVEVFKRALAGPDFGASRVGQAAFKQLKDSFVVIGHNRAATRGVVKDYTAHPFTFGTITGCHNGTLTGNGGLSIHKHPVDSMNLLDALSRVGEAPQATDYAEFLSTVRGSFALTWYDAATEMMWMARNDERPLAYFEDEKGMYWASEAGMLRWLGLRNSLLKNTGTIEVLKHNTIVGYNTREMQFEDYATFDDPKPLPLPNHGGGGYGHRSNHWNSSTAEPVPFDSKELGMRVLRLATERAIEKKMWAQEDTEAFIVFDHPPKKNGNAVLETRGTAYLAGAEKVPMICYPKAGELDFSKVYTGEIVSIYFSEEDHKVVPQVTVAAATMKALDDDPAELKASLEAEAWHDLSTPFPEQEGDGDQGEATQEAKGNSKAVVPINQAKAVHAKALTFRGPSGKFISVKEFDDLTKDGCNHCNAEITHADADDLGWWISTGKSKPICPDCTETLRDIGKEYGVEANLS